MEKNYTVHCGEHYVRTTVTATPSTVRKWVYNIRYRHRYRLHRSRLLVGLGVQWVPGSGTAAATLQLCVGHNCLIFQLIHADHFPSVLRRFLVDPDVIFVGLWNFRDASMLMGSRHDVEVGKLVDVREVASDFRGYSRRASMGTLAADILGLHGMEKEEWVGRSDWGDYRLSREQVKYACHDVFLAFLMAKELRVWNWVDDD
ncbi:hypothetical protein C2S52_010673 [Perilla frutescens var. hirtella]|nr:hypothetical protein C2S52_010673 [Perilla frutescens var. hirtella]KAH6817495.1 hypothetical protein C2S51_001098 [Perilla frutescens var. frutescens]